MLSQLSEWRLMGVHPALVATVRRAASRCNARFLVVEGVRTIERQRQLVAEGRSKTMRSRHLRQSDGLGHAVDLAPLHDDGRVNWNDFDGYRAIKQAMFAAADWEGLKLRWGNDWDMDGVEVGPDPDESFQDWPHFEIKQILSKKEPAEK